MDAREYRRIPLTLSPAFDPALAYPSNALHAAIGDWEEPHFRTVDRVLGDWEAQLDLTWIVGLLLRGWRKGLDADVGLTLASGVAAADDLAWWCERAVEAARRRLKA